MFYSNKDHIAAIGDDNVIRRWEMKFFQKKQLIDFNKSGEKEESFGCGFKAGFLSDILIIQKREIYFFWI